MLSASLCIGVFFSPRSIGQTAGDSADALHAG